MADTQKETTGQRLSAAFELAEVADWIMQGNLRRRFPDASDAEIERRLIEWRRTRPGAEHGDGEGHPRSLGGDRA